MLYSEFKPHFINNVLTPYLKNDKGKARLNLVEIYRNGKNNPRGTLYQVSCAINDAHDVYLNIVNELRAADRHEDILNTARNYFQFAKEINGKNHPMIEKEISAINLSMIKYYPNPKSIKFTKFIILKLGYPVLNKLKFLSRFL